MTTTSVRTVPVQQGSWWPSRHGDGDEAGTLNEITPAKVIETARLVRTDVVHDLAHVLHHRGKVWHEHPRAAAGPATGAVAAAAEQVRGGGGRRCRCGPPVMTSSHPGPGGADWLMS